MPKQAGYSGTPLAKKLGIKAGFQLSLVGEPATLRSDLEPLPDSVTVGTKLMPQASDVVVAFFTELDELQNRVTELVDSIKQNGGLWLAWPKRSSGVQTDLSDAVVRKIGLGTGLVDNKVCAVDETWSALRFVVRVKDRLKDR